MKKGENLDGFEQWWKENGKSLIKSQPDYKDTAEEGFRAGVLYAESMVREEEEGMKNTIVLGEDFFDIKDMQTRYVRDGNRMLSQGRSNTIKRDGTIIEGEWDTYGIIENYGEVFDDKPSMFDIFIGWLKGNQ